jgi:hypothetical protein
MVANLDRICRYASGAELGSRRHFAPPQFDATVVARHLQMDKRMWIDVLELGNRPLNR